VNGTVRESDLKVQLQENRPKYQPPKSKEELEAFKNDYPDIYGVVETVSHLQSQNEVKTLQEELESLKKANTTLQQKEAALELSKYHPDFEEIKESDDFHNWADTQPMEIKNWIYENNSNGALAARAIDLYKKDRGLGFDKKTTKKQRRMKVQTCWLKLTNKLKYLNLKNLSSKGLILKNYQMKSL